MRSLAYVLIHLKSLTSSFPLGRLGFQLKINCFLSFSHAQLSSNLQSDGYVHYKLKDLPPIVTLPYPIRVFYKVFAIVLFFYPLYVDFSLILPFLPPLHAH